MRRARAYARRIVNGLSACAGALAAQGPGNSWTGVQFEMDLVSSLRTAGCGEAPFVLLLH